MSKRKNPVTMNSCSTLPFANVDQSFNPLNLESLYAKSRDDIIKIDDKIDQRCKRWHVEWESQSNSKREDEVSKVLKSVPALLRNADGAFRKPNKCKVIKQPTSLIPFDNRWYKLLMAFEECLVRRMREDAVRLSKDVNSMIWNGRQLDHRIRWIQDALLDCFCSEYFVGPKVIDNYLRKVFTEDTQLNDYVFTITDGTVCACWKVGTRADAALCYFFDGVLFYALAWLKHIYKEQGKPFLMYVVDNLKITTVTTGEENQYRRVQIDFEINDHPRNHVDSSEEEDTDEESTNSDESETSDEEVDEGDEGDDASEKKKQIFPEDEDDEEKEPLKKQKRARVVKDGKHLKVATVTKHRKSVKPDVPDKPLGQLVKEALHEYFDELGVMPRLLALEKASNLIGKSKE